MWVVILKKNRIYCSSLIFQVPICPVQDKKYFNHCFIFYHVYQL